MLTSKPSRLSTAFFAAGAFYIAVLVAFISADTWLPAPIGENETLWAARSHRGDVLGWMSYSGAFVVAIFAGWAWRSPASTRFQCCFWSGVALLCQSLAYVLHITNITAAGDEGYDIWAAPLTSTFTVGLAVILLLTAIFLDRSSHESEWAAGVRTAMRPGHAAAHFQR